MFITCHGKTHRSKALWAALLALAIMPAASAQTEDTLATEAKVHHSGQKFDFQRHDLASGTKIYSLSNSAFAGEHSNRVSLQSGELFISTSKHRLAVKAGNYTVELNPSTMAHLSYEQGMLKVKTLLDEHVASTVIQANGRSVSISCGTEIILGPDIDTIGKSVVADKVLRRRFQIFEFGDGSGLMCADFESMSFLSKNELMKALFRSKSAEEQKISGKILKMQAAYRHSRLSHVPYMQIVDTERMSGKL